MEITVTDIGAKRQSNDRGEQMSSSVVEKFYSMEYGPAPEDASEVVKLLVAHGRALGN
jgi:hypothetical protein